MYFSVSEMRDFYASDIGVIVHGVLQSNINGFWPDMHGLRVLGCGYSGPYLDDLRNRSERCIAMSTPRLGPVETCTKQKNISFTSSEFRIPLENSSVDRILLIHHLEHCDHLRESLQETWRILKPNGRIMVIVPNRMGVWARADWSPFGHGHPFTSSQLCSYLRDNKFVQERHKSALFVPPMPDSPIMMKSSNLIERMAGNILPFVAGVHIVEASKQIYASIDNSGTGSAVLAKTKALLKGNGSTVAQNLSAKK